MKDSRSIEEQVAELTEHQKDTVVKVGIWGSVILCVTTIPMLLMFLSGVIMMVVSPLTMTDTLFTVWLIFGALIAVFVIVYWVVIKAAFPYYSDKKAQYIIKSCKNK